MPVGVDHNPLGQLDQGDGRDEREARRRELCLERLAGGVYCGAPKGHAGDHAALCKPRPMPVNTFDKGKVQR